MQHYKNIGSDLVTYKLNDFKSQFSKTNLVTTPVRADVFSLLKHIENKNLRLYGYKTAPSTSLKLQLIDVFMVVDVQDFYNQAHWNEDWSIYKDKNVMYINLSIRKTNLEELIKKVTIQYQL